MATDVTSLKQLVLGRKDVQDFSDTEQELPPDLMTVNMGPSHPAMHGTVRIVLTVDGERIVKGDVQPGYLHRCFEKESEYATYTQVFPYTDRLNYVSPMINNVGWAMAVEKLMDLKVPRRAEYVRVIVSEISRITDHLTCVGASAMELGAFTAFLYFLKAREWLYELLEKISGARLTHSYVRVGGVWRFDMAGPDGTVWPNRIDYLEIVPESKLVMDHGDDGGDISFLVTVTLDEQQDGKTVLTMRQLHPSQEARDGAISFGAVELGFQTLDKLAERLAV